MQLAWALRGAATLQIPTVALQTFTSTADALFIRDWSNQQGAGLAPTDCAGFKARTVPGPSNRRHQNGAHFKRVHRLQPSCRFALSPFSESGRNQPKVTRPSIHSFIAHNRLPRA